MIEHILLALLLGITIGIITGTLPGLHVNLIAVIVLSLSPLLLQLASPLLLAVFLISLAITHTFLDALPSIYLGAPDESQALNVLPGHRLLLRGKGHLAILWITFGSFGSLLLSILLLPLFIFLMKIISSWAQVIVVYLLLGIVLFLLWKEQKKIPAFCIFLLAGTLGILVFDLPLQQPLFPLLSGLFGCSLLLMSLLKKTNIPAQNINFNNSKFPLKKNLALISGASFSGFLAAFLPGVSTSQVAVFGAAVLKKMGDVGFLTFVGGVSTANMLISLGTLYALEKARNGAIVAVQELLPKVQLQEVLLFSGVALTAGGIACMATLWLSKKFCKILPKINYPLLIKFVLCFIALLVLFIDGPLGILVLAVATALGIMATSWGIAKHHLMGCLLVPVILYFIL